jgi:hypothetical protein
MHRPIPTRCRCPGSLSNSLGAPNCVAGVFLMFRIMPASSPSQTSPPLVRRRRWQPSRPTALLAVGACGKGWRRLAAAPLRRPAQASPAGRAAGAAGAGWWRLLVAWAGWRRPGAAVRQGGAAAWGWRRRRRPPLAGPAGPGLALRRLLPMDPRLQRKELQNSTLYQQCRRLISQELERLLPRTLSTPGSRALQLAARLMIITCCIAGTSCTLSLVDDQHQAWRASAASAAQLLPGHPSGPPNLSASCKTTVAKGGGHNVSAARMHAAPRSGRPHLGGGPRNSPRRGCQNKTARGRPASLVLLTLELSMSMSYGVWGRRLHLIIHRTRSPRTQHT